MSAYGSGCGECVRCEVCEDVAYCLSEPGTRPCPHDKVLCGACNLIACQDCRLDAEAHMYRSGEYDPRADPFYRPEAEAQDAAYWNRPPLNLPGSPGFKPKDSA